MSSLPEHQYNLRRRKLPNVVDINEQNVILPSLTERPRAIPATDDLMPTWSQYSCSFVLVAIISVFTRLYMVNASPLVVWDEAHFGKFANWYITRTFYFDVHPPLGKMLIAFFGYMHGYDGSFSFDSGKNYEEHVPIGAMRAWCAMFGALVAPLIYGTCRNLFMNKKWAFSIALLTVFDNAFLSISKFVLLDPILLCFTASSLYGITGFESISSSTPLFGPKWHLWLFFTGLSLGCVISVKWVGLFTYATVGLFTIRQLWNGLPLLRGKFGTYVGHWFFRIFYLILIPFGIYMMTFFIHFKILEKSGPGDSHMSSLFQSRLRDSPIQLAPEFITIDKSFITIRNHGYGGGLLHSHHHGYPTGSKQSQITLYHHRDENNQWKVCSAWNSAKRASSNVLEEGSVIRLFHNSTQRNLHSHSIPAPISVYENEASGYGNSTFGDDKDHWVVEIVETIGAGNINSRVVRRLTTTFRLKHQVLGCYLSSTGQRLPEWGFEQMEVVCARDESSNAHWNVEQNDDGSEFGRDATGGPLAELPSYGFLEFLRDFRDLNYAMWFGNNALTPKLGKKDILVSTPSQWPFLQVGLRMCNWNDDTRKFYLLGNPVIWWTSAAAIIVFALHVVFIAAQSKVTGYMSFSDERYIVDGALWMMAWALHYIPFHIMGRVTYLHHYFPALLMSIMLLAHMGVRFAKTTTWLPMGLVMVTGAAFVYFAPLSYGFTGPAADTMESRRWRSTWNLV